MDRRPEYQIHLKQPSTTPVEISPTASTPQRQRTLILCFDGTDNSPVEMGTSVARIFFNLDKSNDASQRAYYQPGLGTYVPPTGPLNKVGQMISTRVDVALAWYLSDHIISGYRFLMNNYHDNDKICIFGFSRGAYTARCLGAMISCVGLLYKDNVEMVPFAYSLYKNSSGLGVFPAAAFRRKLCRDISIDFMGLWDTVSSVGIRNRTLPSSSSRGIVKTFRQALALDERRVKFQPIPLYHAPDDLTRYSTNVPELVPQVRLSWIAKVRRQPPLAYVLPGIPPLGPSPNARPELLGGSTEDMWFVGSHGDVGGSKHPHSDGVGLSTLPFLWMLQELTKAKITLRFKDDAFWRDTVLSKYISNQAGVEQAICQVKREFGIMLEGEEENLVIHEDREVIEISKGIALACSAKIKDPLVRKPAWHFLEWIPFPTLFFNEYGERCHRFT